MRPLVWNKEMAYGIQINTLSFVGVQTAQTTRSKSAGCYTRHLGMPVTKIIFSNHDDFLLLIRFDQFSCIAKALVVNVKVVDTFHFH